MEKVISRWRKQGTIHVARRTFQAGALHEEKGEEKMSAFVWEEN